MSERTEFTTSKRVGRQVNSNPEIAKAFSKALGRAIIAAPVLATVAYGYEIVVPAPVYADSCKIAVEVKLTDQNNSQNQTIEIPCNSITQIQKQLKNVQSGPKIATAIPTTPNADATPSVVAQESSDQSNSQKSKDNSSWSTIAFGLTIVGFTVLELIYSGNKRNRS